MSKGFVQSGKLGPVPSTRRLGAVPIPIANVPSSDRCPLGYTRNAVGVCMLGPDIVSGATTVYTTPLVLAGRHR